LKRFGCSAAACGLFGDELLQATIEPARKNLSRELELALARVAELEASLQPNLSKKSKTPAGKSLSKSAPVSKESSHLKTLVAASQPTSKLTAVPKNKDSPQSQQHASPAYVTPPPNKNANNSPDLPDTLPLPLPNESPDVPLTQSAADPSKLSKKPLTQSVIGAGKTRIPTDRDKIAVSFEQRLWELPATDPDYRGRTQDDNSDDDSTIVGRWYNGTIWGNASPRKLRIKKPNGSKVRFDFVSN